jgi:hypothetical protein
VHIGSLPGPTDTTGLAEAPRGSTLPAVYALERLHREMLRM